MACRASLVRRRPQQFELGDHQKKRGDWPTWRSRIIRAVRGANGMTMREVF